MEKKKLLKSIFISILICSIGSGIFAFAIILYAPKKEISPTPPATAKADPNAIVPQSLIGSWEMTSPKLGHAQIILDKDGGGKFKSNGMSLLLKYSAEYKEKTIILQLNGIVDGTATLTGEMTSAQTIKWREIKDWDLGDTPIEWVKK